MPAQALLFFYFFISIVVFPFSAINFLILKTPILSSVSSFIISTSSMDPSISKGSLIYTLSESKYTVGDVIAFKDSIGTVVHRVVGIESIGSETYYQTKGDANSMYDYELIPREKIYGRAFIRLPFIGDGILYLKNSNLILLGAVLPACLAVLFAWRAGPRLFPH